MSRSRRKKVEQGTLIHGTSLEEDLIPAFIDAILEFGNAEDKRIARQIQKESKKRSYYGSEDAAYDVHETLPDVLDRIAADSGFYFGSHPGDGSDFGFWYHIDDDW